MGTADRQRRHIIAERLLHHRLRIGSAHDDGAQVAQVKHPDRVADGLMFSHHAAVVDRHLPSGKGRHPGIGGNVTLVQWRVAEGGNRGIGLCGVHGAGAYLSRPACPP